MGVKFFKISVLRESTKQFATQCTQGGRISILELDLMVKEGE